MSFASIKFFASLPCGDSKMAENSYYSLSHKDLQRKRAGFDPLFSFCDYWRNSLHRNHLRQYIKNLLFLRRDYKNRGRQGPKERIFQ
jgi:hypothetical protein